jgi:hypothetical protein
MPQRARASIDLSEAAGPTVQERDTLARVREPSHQRTQGLATQTQWTGNQSSLRRLSIQRKIAVGSVHDPLEAEADRAADDVLHSPASQLAARPGPPALARKDSHWVEGEKKLNPESVNPAGPWTGEAPDIVRDVLDSAGQPLDHATRSFFEPRFGYDFSGVRIHTGSQAAESARAVNALAYTVGDSVVFAEGRFSPGTQEGRHLLAHELTHTVQQQRAPAALRRQPADTQTGSGGKAPGPDLVLRKEYPIYLGAQNEFKSKLKHDTILGIETSKVVADNSYRILNAAGLSSYMRDITKGVLTPFEESILANWGDREKFDTVVPIYAVNVGLFGYELVSGGSGDRIHRVYSRLGEQLSETHSEAALVSEGLGPIDYVLGGAAALGIGKFLLSKLAKRAAAKLVLKEVAEEGAEELGNAVGGSVPAPASAARVFTPAEQEGIDLVVQSGYSREFAEELALEARKGVKVLNPGAGTKGWKPWKPGGGG